MDIDVFIIFSMGLVVLVYGTIVVIALIFTFSLETYLHFNKVLNLEFLSAEYKNPLERNKYSFDDWLSVYNKIFGPVLSLLSLWILVSMYKIIGLL